MSSRVLLLESNSPNNGPWVRAFSDNVIRRGGMMAGDHIVVIGLRPDGTERKVLDLYGDGVDPLNFSHISHYRAIHVRAAGGRVNVQIEEVCRV